MVESAQMQKNINVGINCEHDVYEICYTPSCPKCYYEELMKRPTKQEINWGKEGNIPLDPMLTMSVHQRERYIAEQKKNG